jgi:hypothetical protein
MLKQLGCAPNGLGVSIGTPMAPVQGTAPQMCSRLPGWSLRYRSPLRIAQRLFEVRLTPLALILTDAS